MIQPEDDLTRGESNVAACPQCAPKLECGCAPWQDDTGKQHDYLCPLHYLVTDNAILQRSATAVLVRLVDAAVAAGQCARDDEPHAEIAARVRARWGI